MDADDGHAAGIGAVDGLDERVRGVFARDTAMTKVDQAITVIQREKGTLLAEATLEDLPADHRIMELLRLVATTARSTQPSNRDEACLARAARSTVAPGSLSLSACCRTGAAEFHKALIAYL